MQIHLPLTTVAVPMNRALAPFILKLAKEFDIPLLPFLAWKGISAETAVDADDGIHPNRDAQPFIADWMAKQLTLSLLNNSSCMKAARKRISRERRYLCDWGKRTHRQREV